MPVLKYWDGAEWIHVGAGGAWSPGDLKQTFVATADEGWLMCDGSLVAQVDHPALFDAIGHSGNGGNDPGGGNFRLPDLREKFTMGKGVSQGLMEAGGSNDAVAVAHAHAQDAHEHPLLINDLFGSTGTNNNDTASNGVHPHGIDGDFGNRIAVTVGSGAHRIPVTAAVPSGQDVSYTDIDDDGAHVHGMNNHSHTATHGHSGAAEAVAAITQSGGVSGTNKNRPAFLTVNYLIKT